MSRIPRKNYPHGPSSSLVDAHNNPALPSPPESDPIQDHLSAYEDHYSPPDQQPAHETPVSRIRRLGMPNVTYTGGGLTTRESRSSHRQSKWLITVFPPKSLNREPPTLGHTLSSAPAGRFSNGILVPLFPTLYAQLTAIAREFNIPSITGLCVYLQLQESGSSPLTPRISDETWQILWSSYFADDHSAHIPSHGLPVCGRIEFDIDITRAKWYNAWMGFVQEGISRESSVVPFHWRGESRTSLFHPDPNDDNTSPPQETSLSKPTRRQAPRPLYLEKREFLHQRSSSRNSARNVFQDLPDQHENLLPPVVAAAPQRFVPNTLSPMVQELEEPQSSKNPDLNTIVKKWRESSIIASAAPSARHAVNTTSPDSEMEFKLDLKDFTWSVSSAGPPSQSPASPGWPERLPSIHLADRMQASRCNTPTSCTSWGPSVGDGQTFDYERQSYRLPSPDIGQRTLDHVPLSPSTCTSWGPDDLPSPVFSHSSARALSVDVGARAVGSAPATPLTCTTWGPADVASPVLSVQTFGGLSLDLGARRRGSVPVTPSTVTSWGPPDTPVMSQHTPTSPYVDGRVSNDLDDVTNEGASRCWPHVWPYNRDSGSSVANPWVHVWPYVRRSDSNDASTTSEYIRSIEVSLEQYPALRDLYPPQNESITVSDSVRVLQDYTLTYLFVRIYGSVYPHNLADIYPETPSRALASADRASSCISSDEEILHMAVCYPTLVIYPPVYPYNLDCIYPPSIALGVQYSDNNDGRISWPDVNLLSMAAVSTVAYPEFDLYPSVYPFHLDHIYPEVAMNLQQSSSLDMHAISYTEYPSFALYSPVYPFNLMDIYPSVNSQDGVIIEDVELRPNSTMPQYPTFDLYPSVYPYNLMEVYPVKMDLCSSMIDTNMFSSSYGSLPASRYPFLEIYPAVYPYSLANIYPVATVDDNVKGVLSALDLGTSSSSGFRYPFFDIYPQTSNVQSIASEYPQITLYGTVHGKGTENIISGQETPGNSVNNPVDLSRSSTYPFMDVYPQIYSYAIEYPEDFSLSLAPSYPVFDLYPAVYPFNLENIYGSIFLTDDSTCRSASEQRVADHTTDYGVYPHLTIYPAGYPWSVNQIYQPVVRESRPINNPTDLLMNEVKDDLEKTLPLMEYSQGYPTFTLYPPQRYPDFVLYPQIWQGSIDPTEKERHSIPATHANYPAFNLYPPQYPFISVYPDVVPIMRYSEQQSSVQQATPEHIDQRYPFFDLYPPVYPHFDLYPPLRPLMQDPTTCPTKSNPPTAMKLQKHGMRLQQTSEQSTPPPIPSKPKTLRGTPSRSNSLETSEPIKRIRKRTHHELYIAVMDDVQRALEHESISEDKKTDGFEGSQGFRTTQKPSLLRKPSVIMSRYIPPPVESRPPPTYLAGLPYSPKDTRTVSTFTGNVSRSIHSRVQSMHLQSLSKSKEETERSGLERSKSLSDRTASIVHARAKLYSAANDKHPPPLPRKPSIKLSGSNPT